MEDINQYEEIEIDFLRIFAALKKKVWMLLLAAVAGTVAALLVSVLLVTPRYISTVTFCVSTDSGDVAAAEKLVESCLVILDTRENLEQVAKCADVNHSMRELRKMISGEKLQDTPFFTVTISCRDARQAAVLGNVVGEILPERIRTVLPGTSADVVDPAVPAENPSEPDILRNALIGLLAGFVFTAASVVLGAVYDTTIQTEQDIAKAVSCPVLTIIPDAGNQDKPELTAQAGAAFSLLRTKLYGLNGGNDGSRIICLCSIGENDSVTAMNLSRSLARQGKRVLLMDCNYANPIPEECLGISGQYGLFDLLEGRCDMKTALQKRKSLGSKESLYVMRAGKPSVNSGELLDTAQMRRLLRGLREICDDVILNAEFTGDTLAAAAQTDGVLLVVRQGKCDREMLQNTVRQFSIMNTKILGVVFYQASDKKPGFKMCFQKE